MTILNASKLKAIQYYSISKTMRELIKKYGVEVVQEDIAVWRSRGYTINSKGLLEKIPCKN